jgi:hypothetical protein
MIQDPHKVSGLAGFRGDCIEQFRFSCLANGQAIFRAVTLLSPCHLLSSRSIVIIY